MRVTRKWQFKATTWPVQAAAPRLLSGAPPAGNLYFDILTPFIFVISMLDVIAHRLIIGSVQRL